MTDIVLGSGKNGITEKQKTKNLPQEAYIGVRGNKQISISI